MTTTEPRKQAKREAHPAARVGAVLLALVILVGKLVVLRDLEHDGRVWICVIFGIGGVLAFYRGKPLACAANVAVVIAVAIRPHPWTAGVAVGAAAFVAFGLVSVAIGWLLSRRDRPGPGDGLGWLGET